MMEWLLVLLVLLVLAAIVAFKYRRQLQTAFIMYRTFRRMRQQMKPKQKRVEPKARSGDTELVRCPKCNKWVPKDEAVKLKSNFYCSLSCLEESVTLKR